MQNFGVAIHFAFGTASKGHVHFYLVDEIFLLVALLLLCSHQFFLSVYSQNIQWWFFFLLKKLQCSILFANSSWPWNSLCLFRVDILAKVSLYIWHFSVIFNFILVSMYSHVWFGLGKWCLMPLLIMIQLYGGDPFYWWRKLQTCRKSLTNFTYSNVVSSTPRHDLDLNSQL